MTLDTHQPTPALTEDYLKVTGFSKFYGETCAVRDVSLGVREGELLALLGPSGSGKSTLLMAIAGFEAPSSGDITIAGRSLLDLPPHRRGIGMVFQRYALFPHMTVAENIAYPLRRRNTPRREIAQRVQDALELVRLDAFGTRLPTQLSGGQQQRVALARGLVFQPALLLLDEPLGALDRKLRLEMQIELKQIHQRVGTTMILVTHDQEEALSLADRIAVLDGGRIQQFGTPAELYDSPANAFVADFIGESNLIPANRMGADSRGVSVKLNSTDIVVIVPQANVCAAPTDDSLLLGARPEDIALSPSASHTGAVVVQTNYLGAMLNVLLQLGPYQIRARIPARMGTGLAAGQPVKIGFKPEASRLYAAP
jgi:spermidine/putrescine ABC transporter ATP-binding subunit